MSNKQIIKSSIEYRYHQFYFRFLLCLFLLFNTLFTVLIIVTKAIEILPLVFIFEIFVCIPLVYFTSKLSFFRKNFDNFILVTSELKEIHSAIWLRTLYYSVEINYQNQKYKRDTNAIFNTNFLSKMHISEYNNRKVTIGFLKDYQTIIVINVLGE